MAGPQLFAVEVLTEDEREFFLRSPQHFWHAIDLEATGLTEEWQQKERENAAWLS
jgi:hypothetical protein